MFVYAGTFTNGFQGSTPAEGIGIFRFDETNGQVDFRRTVTGLDSPSFLARHPRSRILYAVEREYADDHGAVATFAIAPITGDLSLLDRRSSGGSFPAHISLSQEADRLFIANPRSASLAWVDLAEDGVPMGSAQSLAVSGSGPHPKQSAPWLHSAYADARDPIVYACDLGSDRVWMFKTTPDGLSPADPQHLAMPRGAGPRHLALHGGGRFLYVAGELDGSIVVFAREGLARWAQIQSISAAPEDGVSGNEPAELVLGPDGGFLYCSVRGHDSIAQFAVDKWTGRLRLIGHIPCGGKMPRHFAIDPSGRWMLVANQLSDSITVFAIDRDSGRPVQTGRGIATPCPVCLVFSPE